MQKILEPPVSKTVTLIQKEIYVTILPGLMPADGTDRLRTSARANRKPECIYGPPPQCVCVCVFVWCVCVCVCLSISVVCVLVCVGVSGATRVSVCQCVSASPRGLSKYVALGVWNSPSSGGQGC